MAYVVMVTRPTENPQSPVHRFPLSGEDGQPQVFSDAAGAEEARVRHLATFPADTAEVLPGGEARGQSAADSISTPGQ